MRSFLAVLIGFALAACSPDQAPEQQSAADAQASGEAAGPSEPLVVYSSRIEALIQPLFERYEAETGERIRFLTDADGALIARLDAEGVHTPADILMTVDAGNLWRAADLGLLQPLESPEVSDAIPSQYRDSKNRWTALSLRARTIVYSTERVDPENLSSYTALADDAWQDRLCLRTSKKVYNQSLVAAMIARLGEEKTEQVVRGWVDNLAEPPFANDTAVVEAIVAGQCDVGIINSYYFGRLEAEDPEIPAALFWANQGDGEGGTHVNVSGAGVTAHSRHAERARALIAWLAEGEAQQMYAELNMEFPANPEVEADEAVKAWGDFRADDLAIEKVGELQPAAVKLMDRAGYR